MSHHTIFTALKRDHERIHALLEMLAERSRAGLEDTRAELLAELSELLPAHGRAEVEVFYDALEEHVDSHDIAVEGAEEHAAADLVLCELNAMPFGGEPWHAQLTLLRDLVEQHIEEEEREMFPKASELLSDARLVELAVEFEDAKPVKAR